MIADCIGLRFGGDPLKAADAAGIYVRWRDLPGRMALAYFYPTTEKNTGAVIISRSAPQRNRLIALGLAHHILRHRELRPYTWSLEGPLDVDWRAEQEAREFATALLACVPGRATVYARGGT